MMSKNNVKYLFRYVSENRQISTYFNRICEKNIVMMGKNDIKVLKHKGTIGNLEIKGD